jgi:hypothetical protein
MKTKVKLNLKKSNTKIKMELKKWIVVDPSLRVVEEFRYKCNAQDFLGKRRLNQLKITTAGELEILKLKREIECENNADYLDKEKIKKMELKLKELESIL